MNVKKKGSVKLAFTWIFGAILLLAGVWILENLEVTLGVGEFSYYTTLLLTFILFLAAGLCWIAVAVATRRE